MTILTKPGKPSTSTSKRYVHDKKLMLCVWWDQQDVPYYELIQPNETVAAERHREQMTALSRALHDKRPEWAARRRQSDFASRKR